VPAYLPVNASSNFSAHGALHQYLLELYAAPSILLNPDDKIVHLSESAGRYLTVQGGEPSVAVSKLVADGLRIELLMALHTAREQKRPVRSRAVSVNLNGESVLVSIEIRPAALADYEGFVLVLFDEAANADGMTESAASPPPEEIAVAPLNNNMEAELAFAKLQLQKVIERYESNWDDMMASQEEMQSTNEELRSTMEELETSKEELQSINEELQALNQENRLKVDELAQRTNDLSNLLKATEIATLFLDRDLQIMRFTPMATALFNIRPSDEGRPLADLTHRLIYPEMARDARRVLRDGLPVEREVADRSGHMFLTRATAYHIALTIS
jgi:two-component system CheB/CheR fusion protein